MKELKHSIYNDMTKGFAEINQLLTAYKFHLDSGNGKSKDEELEDFIHDQMNILITLCSSHLYKIQRDMVNSIMDWKKKKEVDT